MSLREKEIAALQDHYKSLREEVNNLNSEYVKTNHELFNHNNESKREIANDYFETELNILKIKVQAIVNYARDKQCEDSEIDIDEYLDEALNGCDDIGYGGPEDWDL